MGRNAPCQPDECQGPSLQRYIGPKKRPLGAMRCTVENFTRLYIVEHATSHAWSVSGAAEPKIAAALAPLEEIAPVVASEAFPSTFMRRSPFAVPSCFATVARANQVVASSPAMPAINAMSSGGQLRWPCLQLLMCWGAAPISFANFASLPAIDAARSINEFNSSMWFIHNRHGYARVTVTTGVT